MGGKEPVHKTEPANRQAQEDLPVIKRQRGKYAYRRRTATAGLMVLAGTMSPLLTGMMTAAHAGVPASKSPIQKGLAFYRGKTITLISPSPAGGSIDTQLRLLAPYLGYYLHANITIENIPAGGTIPGQDTAAASAPNGLTIGYMDTPLDAYDAVTNTSGPNFSPARVAMLGGAAPIYQVFQAAPSSPYTSFKALVDLSAHSPARILVGNPGFGLTINTTLLINAFGIQAVEVGGYPSQTLEEAGFLRGDAPLMMDALNTAADIQAAGKARFLVNMGVVPKGTFGQSALVGVPTIPELAKKFPPRTAREKTALTALESFSSLCTFFYFVPGKTPPNEVVALRAALKFAETNRALRQKYVATGNATGYVSGPNAKQIYLKGLAALKKVRSIIAS